MIPFWPHIVVIGTVLLLAGYLIGYHDSRHTWNRMRHALAVNLADLETRVIGLQKRLSADPERAAMDHGEIFVINQIERLTKDIRDNIEQRHTEETD